MRKSLRGIAIGGAIVLVIAQALGAVLSVSSFEKTYRESLLSKYRILVGEMRRQVERDVDFGRPIYLLGGVQKMFDGVVAQDKKIGDLYVCLPDGKVLYSTSQASLGTRSGTQGNSRFPDAPPSDGAEEYTAVRIGDSNFVSAPVRYGANALVGTVRLRYEERVVSERIKALYIENARLFVPTLLGAILLLILLLVGSEALVSRGKLKLPSAARATLALGIALLAAQASYAYLNDRFFERGYVALFEDNVDTLGRIMKTDLDRVLGYGVPLKRLKGADSFLARNLARTREAQSISIVDPDGFSLYSASAEGTKSVFISGSEMEAEAPLSIEQDEPTRVIPLGSDSDSKPKAFLAVKVNQKLIALLLREALWDVLTILAVSLVLGFELARMLVVLVRDEKAPGEVLPGQEREEENRRNLQIVRVISFVFFFSALVPLSFLPAYIDKIFSGDGATAFGLSRQTAIGLPIAAYMLGVTIFIPFVGYLSTRLSLRRIFFLSGGLFVAGTLATAFSASIVALAIARLVAGLGYGGMVINGSNLVVASTTERNRSTGFGSWSAGFAAATICAISVGGVIVNRLGFQVGIFVATGSALCLLAFVAFFVKRAEPEKRAVEAVGAQGSSFSRLFRMFRNRSLVVNLLFSSIPFSLAYVGIFQYILPLYMGSSGISAANIGRILTVYGLISLATPLVSRLADRMKNEKSIIIVGNAITGLSLVAFFLAESVFHMENSYILLVFVLLGMGFGGMMIDASEESFLASSKEAKELGEANFLGLYSTFEKITSVAVPIVAGLLVTGLGYSGSIGAIGAFTLAGVAAFALLAKNLRSGG